MSQDDPEAYPWIYFDTFVDKEQRLVINDNELIIYFSPDMSILGLGWFWLTF